MCGKRKKNKKKKKEWAVEEKKNTWKKECIELWGSMKVQEWN